MTARKLALAILADAGYHGDSKTWTRTYIESRVSLAVANQQWRKGIAARLAGVPCSCTECRQVTS